MFNLTYEEVNRAQPFLEKLAACDSLAAAINTRIVTIKRSFDQHFKDLNDARSALRKKYGIPVKGQPDQFDIPIDDIAAITAANAELKDLGEEVVTIPGKKIPYENISQASYLVNGFTEGGLPMHSRAKLAPSDLLRLEWLIEFPADVEAEAPAQAVAATA